MCNQERLENATWQQSHWTSSTSEGNRMPGQDGVVWLSLPASPLALSLALSPGKPRTGRGLVSQRPLTCWQSEPQRLVKRRCHGHAAHRQKRGFLADFLLARKAATRIRPCMEVRDEIGLCTHSTWSCLLHVRFEILQGTVFRLARERRKQKLPCGYTDFGTRSKRKKEARPWQTCFDGGLERRILVDNSHS
jgi:hypothetical protein